jgi:integrase
LGCEDAARRFVRVPRARPAYHLLKAMLDDAVRDRRLASNPASGVKLPRMPTKEPRYLTHQQLEHLAERCGPYRTLTLVLRYCGLRFGEAAALRVRCVDVLNGRLDIAESMTEVRGKAEFGPPKTHQRRAVPVLKSLRKELRRACEGKGPDDFVFTSARGLVLRDGKYRAAGFDAGVRKLNLGDFTPHDLRDVAASFAIASGASVKAVHSMLGHKSATMTLDRYAALWPDELDTVADRMDAARRTEQRKSARSSRGLRAVPLVACPPR